MRALVALALLLPPSASAGFPHEIQLSGFTEHDGLPVLDSQLLGRSYRELVKELGTLVSNKPLVPPTTLGIAGWELGLANQFVLTEARVREDVSPWARAHPDEDPPVYHMVPTLSARKGLPMSTEVGMNVGWIGMTQTGVVSGWGKVAILERYRPSPDLSVQMGYSGYVGNDELELSVLDLGVTLGTTYRVGHLAGVNTAAVSPWVNFTSLRVSAAPRIDEGTIEEIGAVFFQKGKLEDGYKAPIVLPQFGAGFQVESQGVHVKVVATWAPATIPVLATGMGFTF